MTILDLRPYAGPRPRIVCSTPLTERLASAIDYQGDDACWLWKAALDGGGYGLISRDGRTALVHRIVYELLVGPIPAGLELDHLCRVRACCNPRHLEPVTCRENLLRGEGFAARNAEQSRCSKGHPYDETNTYRPPSAPHTRQCRQCKALRDLARRGRR